MKIAFVNGVFPQLSETFVLDQVDHALKRGHEVEILATRCNQGVVHEKIQRNDLYGRVRSMEEPWPRRLRAAAIGLAHDPRSGARVLRSGLRGGKSGLTRGLLAASMFHAPDLMLVNFGTNLPAAVALKQHSFPNAKIAVIFHGRDISKYPEENGWSIYEQAGPHVDLALTVSAFWAEKLRARKLFRRVEVHHMGVDRSQLPARQPHRDHTFSIAFVGRAVEKKGLTYLLQALTMLEELDLRLHVVGDGALLSQAVAYVDGAGLAERVVFYGTSDHDFVLQLMASCDCLVAPSVTAADGDMEGIPMTIMEAMAIGIPVISTVHSGIPELITDGQEGRLVPERDPRALADAIREVASGNVDFVDAARRKVAHDFDMGKQYDAMLDMLEELASVSG